MDALLIEYSLSSNCNIFLIEFKDIEKNGDFVVTQW